MKPVGEPDALIGHVRFDERGWETERCRMAQATAPILDSTDSDEPIIARYVRSLGWSGLSTDDASWAVHDPTETLAAKFAVMPRRLFQDGVVGCDPRTKGST